MNYDDKLKSSCSAVIREAEDAHWRRVTVFLQEAATVLDYLLRRVYAKRLGEDISEPVLYAETADIDGPLSEELVVRYVEAIARSAQAGFVDVDGFPIFGSMECPRKGGDNA